jgi:hypothetical protein
VGGNFVVAAVRMDRDVTADVRTYSMSFSSRDTCPEYGPKIPNPPVFDNDSVFRDLLLTKIVNGIRAAFMSSAHMTRTRDVLTRHLAQMSEALFTGLKKSVIRSSAKKPLKAITSSPFVPDPTEFSRIEAGRKSTRPAFTRSDVLPRLPAEVLSADEWESDKILLGTLEGLFLYNMSEPIGQDADRYRMLVAARHYRWVKVLRAMSLLDIQNPTSTCRTATAFEIHSSGFLSVIVHFLDEIR